MIPVSLKFYVLICQGRANCYHTVLTSISVFLASITGFRTVNLFSTTHVVSGGTWPEACGGLHPQQMCGVARFTPGPSLNRSGIAGVALCGAFVLALVMWYSTSHVKDHPYFTWLGNIRKVNPKAKRRVKYILHITAVSFLLFCTSMELYIFKTVLLDEGSIMKGKIGGSAKLLVWPLGHLSL